jgi:hypothetical protein
MSLAPTLSHNSTAGPSGVYLRATSEDMSTLDGRDDGRRAGLLAERLAH